MSAPSCPAPALESLSGAQQELVQSWLKQVDAQSGDQAGLQAALPGFARQLAEVSLGEGQAAQLFNVIYNWLRWRRVEGYWLAFGFQLATANPTLAIFSPAACLLVAEAQINFNHDLAFSSLELALERITEIRASIPGPNLEPVEKAIRLRLRHYYDFWYGWANDFEYRANNPLSEHFYSYKTWLDFRHDFPGLPADFSKLTPESLEAVLQECTAPDQVYFRVQTRRWLGLCYQGRAQDFEASQQFELGLREASQIGLDTEFGHLARLNAHALMRLQHLPQSHDLLQQTSLFEENALPYSKYWMALTLRELGNVRMLLAGESADPAKRNSWIDSARRAYQVGRGKLDLYFGYEAQVPINRAITQQMFRSYSENALQAAWAVRSGADLLAEFEAGASRQATEAIAEGAAARAAGLGPKSQYWHNREIFNQHLNTAPDSFETFLTQLHETYQPRYNYQHQRIQFSPRLSQAHKSDASVEQLLSLDLPESVFLLFDIGQNISSITLAELQTGNLVCLNIPLTRNRLASLSQQYNQALADLEGLPESVAARGTRQALDELISTHQSLWAQQLTPLLPFLEKKHIKVFPRLQLFEVPLHALQIDGELLGSLCEISYGQTLAAFLAQHASGLAGGAQTSLTLIHDAQGTPYYSGLNETLHKNWDGRLAVIPDPSPDSVLAAISGQPAQDLFFACHGQFFPEDPARSFLRLGENARLGFNQISRGLDLSNCRSVTLGACISGRVRAALNAEYMGLPSAFLTTGLRYLVASLWKVDQLATTLLMDACFAALGQGQRVPEALKTAQADLRGMPAEAALDWVAARLPQYPELKTRLQKSGPRPFEHPYYWAGFYLSGDI